MHENQATKYCGEFVYEGPRQVYWWMVFQNLVFIFYFKPLIIGLKSFENT